MANAKFSLNLDFLSNNVMNLNTTSSSNYNFSNSSGNFISGVSLPNGISRTGIFLDDDELQQCVLTFTAFQAFPVKFNESRS